MKKRGMITTLSKQPGQTGQIITGVWREHKRILNTGDVREYRRQSINRFFAVGKRMPIHLAVLKQRIHKWSKAVIIALLHEVFVIATYSFFAKTYEHNDDHVFLLEWQSVFRIMQW